MSAAEMDVGLIISRVSGTFFAVACKAFCEIFRRQRLVVQIVGLDRHVACVFFRAYLALGKVLERRWVIAVWPAAVAMRWVGACIALLCDPFCDPFCDAADHRRLKKRFDAGRCFF